MFEAEVVEELGFPRPGTESGREDLQRKTKKPFIFVCTWANVTDQQKNYTQALLRARVQQKKSVS